ncbi:hypothetical protein EON79_17245 [bacterium]|nr:MAG: hypothetical protein EON79_17245 [bacterium]
MKALLINALYWCVGLVVLYALLQQSRTMESVPLLVGTSFLSIFIGYSAVKMALSASWRTLDQSVRRSIPVRGLSETAREIGEKVGYPVEGAKAGDIWGVGLHAGCELQVGERLLEDPWPTVRARIAATLYDAQSRRLFRRVALVGSPLFVGAATTGSLFFFRHPENAAIVAQLASISVLPLAAAWRRSRNREGIVRLPHRIEDAEGWQEAFSAS